MLKIGSKETCNDSNVTILADTSQFENTDYNYKPTINAGST